jgi:hypothetical protein
MNFSWLFDLKTTNAKINEMKTTLVEIAPTTILGKFFPTVALTRAPKSGNAKIANTN